MLTHPDKVLFPADGITKRDLAAYYAAVATSMLPHIRARPVTLERFPSGIGEHGFLQKDVARGFPDWLQRVEVPKKGGVVHHPLVMAARDLEWLANQNCITPHVWTSRAPALYQPDICVFDLDPAEDEQPAVLRTAVLAVRDVLAELGLLAWVKTSGSKGFHVGVPLDGTLGFEDVAAFAEAVAKVLVQRDPSHLTLEFTRANRGGRIFVDIGRNGYSATFAAAYAVRARPGAPVSAPCTWAEIESGAVGPRTFTLRSMPARVEAVGDIWSSLPSHPQSLTRPLQQLSRADTP